MTVQRKTSPRFPLFSSGLIVGVLGLLLGLTLVGCPQQPTSSTPAAPRFPNVTLTVSCPADAEPLVKDYARRWTSRTGGQVKVVTGADAATADVVIMSPADLPTHVAAGRLQRVPQATVTPAYEWDRLLPQFQGKLLLWDEVAYALPLAGDAPLLFYRTDLLAKGGKKQPPATWEEVLEFARQVGRNGLPPLPEDDDALDREFFSVAVPFARRALKDADNEPPEVEMFSFHFDLDTGKPRINTPGFVHALELMQQLQPHRSDTPSSGPVEAFARGESAVALGQARWLEEIRRGPMKDVVGVGRVPGSAVVYSFDKGERQTPFVPNAVPYLGAAGWLGGVTASSQQGEAAWDLLAELTGPKTSDDIVIDPRYGGGAVRRGQLDNVRAWELFSLKEAAKETVVSSLREVLVHPGVRNPVLRLRIPGQREYQKALLDEVRLALLKGKKAQEALDAAAARWMELGEKKSAKERKRDYYLSLSLHPPE